MKIVVIGTGNVGSVLARRFTENGHEVTTANSTTDPALLAAAAEAAEVTVLAAPFGAVAQLDPQVKAALSGKVVVDATNPLAADFMSLTVGHTTSGGEQNAATLPGARVVKAFNTAMATTMETGMVGDRPLLLPVAGDDEPARKTVLELAAELGFDAVDAGPLSNARYTEPAVELLIQLAFGQGLGPGIGFTLARA
ncbi:NAD(P)-binding domain-containing protein [Streptomyces lacrimifluminis]|uniref:NADPH-dependent F420 reductase n=1 Tax=Streptomyces lacrimifluminis TaxID=1500077 RepID=A0A917L559_9ACTN|nr:NAD(P)-binding domain-containing protein [Streptomyces lacrimifluminis]GGJ43632.1 NADPH-dependent F420 reductase [Streptomyces lacrimifluminis]